MCPRLAGAPICFWIPLPYSNCIFNRCLCTDLMKLFLNTVLRTGNKNAKFCTALIFLWVDFKNLGCLCASMVKPVSRFPKYFGLQARTAILKWRIEFNLVQPQNHSVTFMGEMTQSARGRRAMHSKLRRISEGVKADAPRTNTFLAIVAAIKVLNDAAGPYGLFQN